MSSTGAWSSSLPLTPRIGAEGLSSRPLSSSDSWGAGLQKVSHRLCPHRFIPGFEQARRAEEVGGTACCEGRHEPLLLEAVMCIPALKNGTLEPARLYVG